MGIIKGAARLQHHRLTTPATAFTVPPSEDFTDGTWTATDLALGEIGINLADDTIVFRTTAGIIQIPTATEALSAVLIAGNATGGTDLVLTAGDVISTDASANVINLDHNAGPITDGTIIGRAASNYLVVSEQQIDLTDAANGSQILLSNAGIDMTTTGSLYVAVSTDVFISSPIIKLEGEAQILDNTSLGTVTPSFSYTVSSGPGQYITNTGQSGSSYDHAAVDHDRYISIVCGTSGGGTVRMSASVETLAGSGTFYVPEKRDITAYASISFLVPTGCIFRVYGEYLTSFSSSVSIVSRKFGN